MELVQTRSGAHPATYSAPIERGLFRRVKRRGRVVNHLPSSNTKVKNVWKYTSIAPYTFMSWCLESSWYNSTQS
jgi:hypothetical protein